MISLLAIALLPCAFLMYKIYEADKIYSLLKQNYIIDSQGDIYRGPSATQYSNALKRRLQELSNDYNEAQRYISELKRISVSDVVIRCHSKIGIAYNNSYVTGPQDFKPCVVERESANEEVDLALIRLADEATPEGAYIFKTSPAGTIPNLNFDDWYQDGKVWYAASNSSTRVWDSANKGAASFIGSTTTPETGSVVSGKAARMESAYAVVKFAAGNIYIGSFVGLAGLGAELDWGMPFSSRPLALHGYYKYSPKAIDYTESPYGSKKGDMDACSIKMYLCDWSAPFRVNTSTSTFLQDDDPSIIAMCDFTSNVATSGYVEFTFPLQYRDARTPKYVVIVGAASRLGDYFTGGKGSTLWLDELSLVYDAGELSEADRQRVGYRQL